MHLLVHLLITYIEKYEINLFRLLVGYLPLEVE